MDNYRVIKQKRLQRPEKIYYPGVGRPKERMSSVSAEDVSTVTSVDRTREAHEEGITEPEKSYDLIRSKREGKRRAVEGAHDKQEQSAVEAGTRDGGSSNDPEAVHRDVVTYLQKEEHDFGNKEDTDKSIRETVELLENHKQWTKDVQGLTDAIIKEYPPDKYSYVGLGRSPSTIIADMQVRGLDATTLPLGGLKTRSTDLRSNIVPKMSDQESKNVSNIIREHIPVPGGNKKVLLIDYVQTGQGLRVGQELVKKALNPRTSMTDRLFSRKSKPEVEVVALGLHSEFSDSRVPAFHEAGLKTMKLAGSLEQADSLASLVGASKFKPFSPFYKFSFKDAKAGKQPEVNPLYGRIQQLFGSDRARTGE